MESNANRDGGEARLAKRWKQALRAHILSVGQFRRPGGGIWTLADKENTVAHWMSAAVAWSLFLLALAAWASPCSAGLKIEAGAAAVKTAGEKFEATSERAESGWVFHTNGELGDYVAIGEAGQYTVVVRACGSPAKGVWPMISLRVDGRPLLEGRADKAAFTDNTFRLKLLPGVHRLTVAFFNDGPVPANFSTQGWKDGRNFYVSRLEIVPPAGAAEPTLSSQEEFAVENLKRLKLEEKALAAVDRDIERNRKGEVAVRVVGAAGQALGRARVEVELVSHDFLFGCNIYMFGGFKADQENALYKQRFADLFNYATIPFYWQSYEPERDHPNYAATDKVVAWCRQQQIRMKGHPLLWAHEAGIPKWSTGQPPADLQKKRVTDILGRYGKQITSWEVVNEPAHPHGNVPVAIDPPYRWAREADPKAYLIVNDFSVLANGCPPFFQLLQKAKADGVPFDGIGIQAHEPATMRFPLEVVKATLDQYATLGKDLHITEFSPASSGEPIIGLAVPGNWDEKAQADYAVKFYRVCFADPAVVAITWWDLCDQGSWMSGGGMLRKDLSPKPVYTALHELIRKEWHSRASGQIEAGGSFHFRGFFGQYRVKVTVGDQTVTGNFHLDGRSKDGQRQAWTVKVAEPK